MHSQFVDFQIGMHISSDKKSRVTFQRICRLNLVFVNIIFSNIVEISISFVKWFLLGLDYTIQISYTIVTFHFCCNMHVLPAPIQEVCRSDLFFLIKAVIIYKKRRRISTNLRLGLWVRNSIKMLFVNVYYLYTTLLFVLHTYVSYIKTLMYIILFWEIKYNYSVFLTWYQSHCFNFLISCSLVFFSIFCCLDFFCQ